MVISPLEADFKRMPALLSGGYNISSTEVLTESGWEIAASMPVPIFCICSSIPTLDDDNYFVAGGLLLSGIVSSQTYIFSLSKNAWIQGPNMPMGRYAHACGRLQASEKTNLLSLIVAGGYNR